MLTTSTQTSIIEKKIGNNKIGNENLFNTTQKSYNYEDPNVIENFQ